MRNRRPNTFEKILLVVGVAVLMVGYGLIHKQVLIDGFTIEITIAIFLWLMLVVLMIIAAVNENIKEELKQMIELQLQETRLLREDIRRK